MTDWGDATLNETARRATMPLPPDVPPEAVQLELPTAPAPTEAERQVPRPTELDPPLSRHDQGARTIPPAADLPAAPPASAPTDRPQGGE
jgi:hypothetical protein